MKEIKVILFSFSLLFVMPYIVKAQCEYGEKNRLQSLATNLNFSYNYVESDEGINSIVNFSITIANLHPDIYVVDQTNVNVYNYNSNKEVVINGYKPGTTTQFIVYANTQNCKGVELNNNYVTLPSYNRFYKDSVCDGVVGYNLCSRWARMTLKYDTFVKKVENYKKHEEVGIPPVKVEISLAEKIIVFLSKYSFYLFGMIIVVCSILIFYLRSKDDFDLG